MTHLGLFEGIGGFSLAARQMGWHTAAWSEINPFCRTVLQYHFPEAEALGDITKTDFTRYANKIDILTGGFPCQPYSLAGKRKGKDDERHLWPQMLRAIREIKPRWVVGENVFGIVSWDGGLVFEEVQADLESEGYEVQPFILPACAVDAPHRRDRVWFVAKDAHIRNDGRVYSERGQLLNWDISETSADRVFTGITTNDSNARVESLRQTWQNEVYGFEATTHTDSRRQPHEEYWKAQSKLFTEASLLRNWQNFPTQSPIRRGDDGIPKELDIATLLKGRKLQKRYKPLNHWRNEAIKALGNAIVPQVALQIFKAIQQYEKSHKGRD